MDHFIDALTDMRLRIRQTRPKNIDEAPKLVVELDAFNQAEIKEKNDYQFVQTIATFNRVSQKFQKSCRICERE